jgi:hypothetical protein
MAPGGGTGQGFNVDPAAIQESLKHLYKLQADILRDSLLVQNLINIEPPGDSPATQQFHTLAKESMKSLIQQHNDYQALVEKTIAQLEATLKQYHQTDQQATDSFKK